jgi:exonuclease III
MKIMTWNMSGAGFHGGASHADAWQWLSNEATFDVALLQEAVPPVGIERSFRSLQFRHKYPGTALRWGNCIVSRDTELRLCTSPECGPWRSLIEGACLVAETTDGGFRVANVHSNANPVKTPTINEFRQTGAPMCHSNKYWEVEAVAHFLKETLTTRRFVFGGDINSSLLFDEVNRYQNNERLWRNLEDQGYLDLRPRHFSVEQQTFFRKGSRAYQLDHMFADVHTCESTVEWKVLTDVVRDLRLSDHAPVAVEF